MRSSLAVRVQAILLACIALVAAITAIEYTADTDRRLGGLDRWLAVAPTASHIVLAPLQAVGSRALLLVFASYLIAFIAWLTPLRRKGAFSPWFQVLSLVWCLLSLLVIVANANLFIHPCSALS